MVVAVLSVVSCGSVSQIFDTTVPTQVDPYINRIAPVTATAGNMVTIFGFGFSEVPELNVVIVGGAAVVADTYSLLGTPVAGEIETLTFTVPAGLTVGANSIYVDVLDNVSNTSISITIN